MRVGGIALAVFLVMGVVGAYIEKMDTDKAEERVEAYLNGTGGEREFFAPDAQFRATFPTPPAREATTHEINGLTVSSILYVSEGEDAAFSVGVSEIDTGREFDLVAAANGQAAGVDGRLEASTMTKFAGYDALESLISADGIFVKSLIVRTPARAYIVQVIGETSDVPGYDRFVDGFQITA